MHATTTRRTALATGVLILLGAGLALVPVAAAENPDDQCNGLIERDGCWYQIGSGVWAYCKLWVAGICVEGGGNAQQ